MAKLPRALRALRKICRLERRVHAKLLGIYYTLINRLSSRPITEIGGPLVSLTTFGPRIQLSYLTIESIGRGHVRPERIILWLDKSERVKELPTSLKRLVSRGLDVKYSENYRSHTKYFPLVSDPETAGHAFVTADDDVLYPRSWLKYLIPSLSDPMCVRAYRVHEIQLEGSAIAPYSSWRPPFGQGPSALYVATGVSGVYYPSCASIALRHKGHGFMTLAPTADDLWIHAVLAEQGIGVMQVRVRPRLFLEVRRAQRAGLWRVNVASGLNDVAVRNLYSNILIDRLTRNAHYAGDESA